MGLSLQDLDSKYNFDSIEDIAALKAGARVQSLKTDIKWHYTSYSDLFAKARKSGDKPLIGRIKVYQLSGSWFHLENFAVKTHPYIYIYLTQQVVQKYGDQIPSLMKRIRAAVTFKMEDAGIVSSLSSIALVCILAHINRTTLQ